MTAPSQGQPQLYRQQQPARRRVNPRVVAAAGIGGFAALSVIFYLTGIGKPPPSHHAPAFTGAASHPVPRPAAWKARVVSTAVIDPATLAVTVKVTDTGQEPGTPSCTVQAHDASYAYHGIDIAQLSRPVKPGRSVFYVDDVTITGQGAQYVSQVTVTCS